MKIERAIEILDPEHREHYESIEPVKEACRMGMKALEKQIPKKPTTLDRKNENGMIDLTFKCPACNAFFFGTTANYCRLCGQKFSWSDEK